MACPHVAGLAAYLIGTGASVSGLCDKIAQTATKNVIKGLNSNTVNALAFNGNPNAKLANTNI